MEDLFPIWNYQENVDELKQRLLYITMELDCVKMEANEAAKKHKEEINNLQNLLQIACQERNEAKDQLQKLFNKLIPSSPTTEFHTMNYPENQNTTIITKAANSTITESNSTTLGSSPVDSFFDTVSVSSPDQFSNMADSSNHLGFTNPQQQQQPFDPADVVIDNLVKGKALPQKGKLLKTVMESGPLLQTLLVAGPLPRWRNPPPPLQSFKIPPFSIDDDDTEMMINQRPTHKPSSLSRVCSQMCSTSILNFSAATGQTNFTQMPIAKRQRFH